MTPEAKTLYALIVQIRRGFHDLAALADRLYADLGITAARRAVIEHLDDHGPETVANIARAKRVSRQHIQQLADQLVEAGLARFEENPAHKRSQLVALTPRGTEVFARLRAREQAHLETLAAALDPVAVASATATVAALRDRIDDPATFQPEPERDR